jgi:hypothetical protein
MPCFRIFCCFLALVCPLLRAQEDAPFIDAKAIKESFSTITAKDMDDLRQRRILVIGMSMSRNLMTGLELLGKSDPQYKLTVVPKSFRKADDDTKVATVSELFSDTRFVHMIGSRRPTIRRIEQIEEILRSEPPSKDNHIDIVMIIYIAEVDGKFFPTYQKRMEDLRREFPMTRFLHCTTSVIGDTPKARNSKGMQDYSDQMRKVYRGKEPIYDLGAILSDDFSNGPVMKPEYFKDSTGVHPDKPEGMLMMGKGFVLAARDTMRWSGGTLPPPATTATPPAATTAPAAPADESLPASHPEYIAVRAILDANNLGSVQVGGQTVVRDGHVVELLIQEMGVTKIPDAIGVLTHLEKLHCYGDRKLGLPFLRTISPEIGKCRGLKDLLLNDNDLETLPEEIAGLDKVDRLALAGNRLRDLSPAVSVWAKRLDPEGLAGQTTSPSAPGR